MGFSIYRRPMAPHPAAHHKQAPVDLLPQAQRRGWLARLFRT